uniref:Solute carrier family 26 member 6 n=1 Tax=Myripristis murdjan TaxID=586833 RepID=A0A667ZUE2_9TELE
MRAQDYSTQEYFVQRDILDELHLDGVARKRTQSSKPPLGERIKDSLRCSGPRLKQAVLGCVPVLSWLPRYSIRENAMGDVISGVSVGIMHLPQGMAYALLAAIPPVFGLYTSLYPVLIYFIFGTSRHISIGTFAVVSIMIGGVMERLAPDSDFPILNGVNGTETVNITARDAYRVQIACAFTVLGGLIQILLGLVRFGFVVTYLSEPLVRGYTTGAACHVTISQLKYLFGIKPSRFSGPLSQIYTLLNICQLLPETNVAELVVSLVALAVLIVVKELNACYSKKLPLPIPIELIVVTATIISYFAGINNKYGVDIVGEIPSGLKAPRVPNFSLFSELIGDAFAAAIVGYAINISLGKTFALKHGYKVDSNQELIALGLSNTIGSFFQCYSVTSSLSRSLIQESTGGKTQVAGVVSSVIVLITVLKIGSLFEDLPKAVLSTIVFVNLKGMFKQFLDVPMLWRTNKVDLLVWLVTFTCTVLLNLDLGLAVSIGFSMLTVIFKTQLPRYSILGQVPGTDLYLDTDTYEEVIIFLKSSQFNLCNPVSQLTNLPEEALQQYSILCPQTLGEKNTKKTQGENMNGHLSNGKFSEESEKNQSMELKNGMLPTGMNAHHQGNGVAIITTETHANGHVSGQVNWAYQHDGNMSDSDSETGCHDDNDTTTQTSHSGDVEKGSACGSGTHSIILDLSTTSFVDTVSVKMLKNMFRDFGEIDVNIYLAGCQACVVEQLERAGFFSESIPKSRLFATIHDAVLHIFKNLCLTDTTSYDLAPDVSCSTKM